MAKLDRIQERREKEEVEKKRKDFWYGVLFIIVVFFVAFLAGKASQGLPPKMW